MIRAPRGRELRRVDDLDDRLVRETVRDEATGAPTTGTNADILEDGDTIVFEGIMLWGCSEYSNRVKG